MAAPPRRTVTLTIRGPLLREDLAGLFERTCALLGGACAETLLCEVDGVAADAICAEALARLALAARRRGCRTQLSGASPELRALVDFLGLAEVLHDAQDGLREPS